MGARIAHGLRRLLFRAAPVAGVSACLLALPALASACPASTTKTYAGGPGSDWATGTNWLGGSVPGPSDIVCIPAGTSATLATPATVAELYVDPGPSAGNLTISGGSLIVGPATASSLSGPVALDGGTLDLNTPTVVDQNGSLALSNSSTVTIDSGQTLTLNDGADVTVPAGVGTIQNGGDLHVGNSTGSNPTNIAAAVNGNGGFSNVGGGPVAMTGGANGSGTWTLGSGTGADEPSLTLAGGATIDYTLQGTVTDNGGLGHLLIGACSYTATAADAQIHVDRLDMTSPSSTMDFSTANTPPSIVDVGTLTVTNGFFEVDTSLAAGTLIQRAGVLLNNGAWTAAFVHWGGGEMQSASPGNGSLTADTLDMTLDGGDIGNRRANGTDLTVTGSATQDYPYSSGTFDVTAGSTFTIGAGVRFVIDGDLDINNSVLAAANVVNHGVIEKRSGAGTSTIRPLVDSDGEIDVTSGDVVLTQAPVQYNATSFTLAGGTYKLAGNLTFPGRIDTLDANVQLTGATIHDSGPGGADANATVKTNAGALTVSGVSFTLPAPSDFTNTGQLTLGSGAVISVPDGAYVQSDPAATTTLAALDSGIDVTSGTGIVALQAGSLGGLGTISGSVVSDATVSPGASLGELFIAGDYTQHASGVLVEEIAGTGGGQFDRLGIGGAANLDGTLLIEPVGGFAPPLGQTYPVIQAGSRTGTFAQVTEPAGTRFYDLAYAGSGFVLSLTANGVSIGDATVTEGATGTVDATFTVSLALPAPAAASVDWTTQDGSATAGSDYAPASGTVAFAPGETAKTVTVAVNGDTAFEPDETFSVVLSNPVGTRIATGSGTGTIVNDDQPAAVTSSGPSGSAVPPGDIDGQATAPPPAQGKTVNVEPVAGTVRVKLPGKSEFVTLPDREQIPTGSIVDTTKGTVRLFAEASKGTQQSANFFQGVFQVTQKAGKALTDLELVGGNFKKACGRKARSGAAEAAKTKKKSVRHLWGEGSGHFRTSGRFASATVRGTKWLTDDRCEGTLVRVAKGAVTVRDLTLKKTVSLKAPKSYLAPAKKPSKKP